MSKRRRQQGHPARRPRPDRADPHPPIPLVGELAAFVESGHPLGELIANAARAGTHKGMVAAIGFAAEVVRLEEAGHVQVARKGKGGFNLEALTDEGREAIEAMT